MLIYYILLLLFILFAIFDHKLTSKSKTLVVILSGILLILFAGFRGAGIDKDYLIYQNHFQKIPNINGLLTDATSFFSSVEYEPTFILIASFIKSNFNNGFPLVIFVYALIGITLKLKAIVKITDQVLLSLLLYFSTIFLLQDMNQIRVGVAIGFALLSLTSIINRNLIQFLVFISLGISFHYSAIAFAPFYFINYKKINKTYYALILIVPILLHLSGFNPLDLLLMYDFGVYTSKLEAYVVMQKWLKESINMFNFSIIIQLIFSVILIIFSEKIENKYAILLTKIYCFGIAIFYLFSFSPVIAFRLSELLTCVQIVLLPMLVTIIKPRYLAELAIITISVLYFLNQIIINNIFKEYFLIFN